MKRALIFAAQALAIGALALVAALLVGYLIGVAILIVWLAWIALVVTSRA